jgi:monovalent cation:H+ antiporter-2, CPA2 family
LTLQVLFKLALVLAGAAALSRSVVPAVINYLRRNYSDELFQMCIVGYCLSCAWMSGKLGLSHELGAFLAGIMIGSMPSHEDVLQSTVQVRWCSFCAGYRASIALIAIRPACMQTVDGFLWTPR